MDDTFSSIGFMQGDGSWSYLGRQVLDRGVNERTMNFGWDLLRSPREADTARDPPVHPPAQAVQGREYVLRIRLAFSRGPGETAVMMW